jgi:hypothetical protein
MARANRVAVGPGGFLQRDGVPVFVIGAYQPPMGKGIKDLAEMGFNVASVGTDEEKWKELEETGLWAWVTLGLHLTEENAEKSKASWKEAVEKVKDHPNMFMYESTDEPAWTDGEPEKPRQLPGPLTAGYNYLKSLDPNHPVYLNHAPRNTVETLRRYNTACDIVCVDVYPVIPTDLAKQFAIIPSGGRCEVPRQTDLPDLSPAVVGDYVDKMKEVAYHDQAVFVVLQGFAWDEFPERKDESEGEGLYPTHEQFRFMAYQAIVHGANGLTVWGMAYNENAESLAGISSTLNEIGRMSPYILGRRTGDQPTVRYAERGSGIGKGVECLVTETEDAVTLFTVNASFEPATARFMALPMAFDGAEELLVLGEDRTLALDHGRFEDDYGPFGVHVYQYRR